MGNNVYISPSCWDQLNTFSSWSLVSLGTIVLALTEDVLPEQADQKIAAWEFCHHTSELDVQCI